MGGLRGYLLDMISREDGRTLFNQVADLYAEVRPSYPDALIDDLLLLSGCPPGGRVLEVGCGAGQASVAFAARGRKLLSLEPGPDLAAIARERLRGHPAAAVEVTTFEDWPLQPEAFDVVAFPSSLKWVSPEVRYTKSAAALKPSGGIAILGNGSHRETSPELRAELDAVYAEQAPELAAPPRAEADTFATTGLSGSALIAELAATGLFGDVESRRYPWTTEYDTETYLKLLNTYSAHIALAGATRRRLFAAIGEVLERHGGRIGRSSTATLHVARRR